MNELLIQLGQLVLGFMVIFGPLIVLLLLLEDRDRWESSLRGTILEQLNSPNLRGLFSFRIHHGLLLGKNTVNVELWECSIEQIWDTTMQLSMSLPAEVRLIVNGVMDHKHKVGFAMEVKRAPCSADLALCCR